MGALDGKVAVVAGATRGIGKGIAVELGAAGAAVYLTGRTAEPKPGVTFGSVQETVAAVEEVGGTAIGVPCDHLSVDEVTALFARVKAEHGRLDVLVNSVFNSPDFGSSIGSHMWELPLDIWHDVVDLGTKTAYITSALAAPLLLEAGKGLLANISGRGAERYRYNVAYGVGKAALDKMTRDMAEEFRDHDVAVVSLWPNVTRTEHMDARGDTAKSAFGDLDLLETPRYSGRAVVALATDPDVMKRTGHRYWVAELAADYGFTDENGRDHELPT
jgi:NAD(P)-dependent dehydrogenase (short-subunit alcohol dehydrogenase family)